jgi:hypothetical protein
VLFPKENLHRDKRLLAIARRAPCFLLVVGACQRWQEGCDPTHPNWQADGRGYAFKAHDCLAVPGCRPCHEAIDSAAWLKREPSQAYHYSGFRRYVPWLITQRYIELVDVNTAERLAIMDGDRQIWLIAWQEKRIRVRRR